MDELEKIDLLRERLGVTYREAKEALQQTEGDVVQALINLEESGKKWDDKLEKKGQEIIEYIKEIVKKGNVTKVRLKKKDKVVLEIPATVGALGIGGMLLSPILTVIGVVGTVAAVVTDYTLEVVRPDGQVEEHDLKFLEEENSNEKEN
jgi:hypothetical protein